MTRMLYLALRPGRLSAVLCRNSVRHRFCRRPDDVPKGIDDGIPTTLASAIVINVSLLLLFAVQHNVMARPWFKDWWTRFVPRPIERSTYVAAASLILAAAVLAVAADCRKSVWHVDNVHRPRSVMWALYFAGWAIVFYSSFVIDHFELFGLKQVWLHFKGEQHVERPVQRAVALPLGPASADARLHHRVLVGADDVAGPAAVRSRHDAVDSDRDSNRRARPGAVSRRAVSRLSRADADAACRSPRRSRSAMRL